MAGLPGISTLATYGGMRVNERSVEDASSEVGADEFNVLMKDTAGHTQTAWRAIRRFVGHATTPAEPASNAHFANWGNSLVLRPPVTKGGTGIYVVTWPATVTDDLGVIDTVNLIDGVVNVNGTTLYHVQVTCAANVATVYVWNAAGALNDAVGVTLALFVR